VDVMKEELISSKKIYEGRVVSLRIDTVRINERRVVREVVEHPGASAVLPITADGSVILISQYRHAAGTELLEIPAGTLKPGESPEECAVRELREETGGIAEKLEYLTTLYPSPGYSNEAINLYVAKIGERVEQKTEPDEDIKVLTLSMDEAVKLIQERKILDAKTIAGLLLIYHMYRRP